MATVRGLGARDLVRKHRAFWPETSFLARLERQVLDELVAGRQGIRFPANQAIITEGEPAGDVFLLLDAVVMVTARFGKGTALLAVRVGGDIVGEMAVADGLARSATVTATRHGDLAVAIPGDEFMAVVERHPAASRLLTAQLSRKLRAADRRRTDFTAHKVPQRVARILAELADDYGRPERNRPGTLTLTIGITQGQLATLVGAGESTVQQVLKELGRQKILNWGYRAVDICDIEALRQFADGAESG
jgi:CRP/FNR family transcriptional regulator, cyclic AMP receptor protein